MPADAVRYELLRRHRACARWRTPFASARAAVAAAPCLTTDARVVAPPRAARRVGGRRRRGRRVVGAGGSPRVRQGVMARALRTYPLRQPRGNSDARPRANGWPGAHQHLALGGRVRRRRRRRRATVRGALRSAARAPLGGPLRPFAAPLRRRKGMCCCTCARWGRRTAPPAPPPRRPSGRRVRTSISTRARYFPDS